LGAVVTARSGYDIRYPVRSLGGERSVGGYYASAAQAGEGPGRWFGRGAAALGLAEGQQILTDAEIAAYEAVYSQRHPVTWEQLGRAPVNSAKAAERRAAYLARLLEAEPHATAERRRFLGWQAAVATRPTAPYADVTVSFSKSISVLHVSIRENARQARLAGNEQAAVWWDELERRFSQVLHAANLAVLRHLETWAGVTRTGSHAARIGGELETGRWEPAGLAVTSWLQGTSRDGDPHDHVHNLFARMVQTDRDGKWRALDTMALRYQLPAAQAIAAAHVEAGLTREFGVAWVPRPDGAGNEICGITQETMDAYSSRAIAVDDKLRDLARAFARDFGRAPNQRELMWLKDRAWEETRDSKPEAPIDWDAHAAECDARLGGQLAQVARAVSPRLRGYDAAPGAAQGAGLSAAQRAAVVSKALARVHEAAATWSRADLVKAIGAELPPSSRNLGPDALVALIGDLADEAIAGRHEPVVPMAAPEWPAQPEHLRRALDGHSVYTRPGTDRYATRVQLGMEEQLLLAAQRQGAPCVSRANAARLLGADPGTLDAALRESAHQARKPGTQTPGLRLDQAAAAYHLLTSPRVVEILIGPAGSGKTRSLAAFAGAARAAGLPVVGLATSQAGRNALAAAGVADAMNVAQFLGHLRGQRGGRGVRPLEPGTVLVLDEASMTPTPDMRDIAVYAAGRGCKLIVSGDHAQLSGGGVGGGGRLRVARLGHVKLAEAVRFAEPWEQDASLRLREGDATVLAEYDDHGRIRGNNPAEAMEDARRLYVARYVQGTDVDLIIHSNALAREMARRVRDDLQHLGIVSRGPEVRLAEGAAASPGDVIIARVNSHLAGVANGDVLRVESVNDDGTVTVRRRLDREATSRRRWAGTTFRYAGYGTADLAYGATAHTKQGKTVTAAITLVTGSETAEWLYSAMTRGSETNIACVFARPGEDRAERSPGTRTAPELARADLLAAERTARPEPARADEPGPDDRDALAVLTDITRRHDAELSATAMRHRNLAHADHLAALHAIWQGETTHLSVARYRQAVRDALPARVAADPLDSAQATWLWRTLRAAEAAGLDVGEVARRAIEDRPLTGARDLAAVIDARIRKQNPAMIPAAWRPWSAQVPDVADPDQARYLTELAAAMDARKDRIGEHAAQTQPAWAVAAAGPVPADPVDRLEWERRISHVGAYRELYGWDHPTEPVGPEPAGDTPEKRVAWHAAYGAMTRTEGIDLRDRPDGTLLKMRESYRAETEWAPPHVAGELRAIRTMLTTMAAGAARAETEAAAARAVGNHDLAAQHERLGASYRATEPVYRQIEAMDAEIMGHRAAWARLTEGSRHLAVMADAELRRRHPHARLDPLRSTEPQEPSAVLPADPATDPDLTARLDRHKQATADFRARLEERQGVLTPAEDHDYQHEGEAWPSPWESWTRDAVLRPPKPEIRPAGPVLDRAVEFEAGQ
jgi:hypothetical protein